MQVFLYLLISKRLTNLFIEDLTAALLLPVVRSATWPLDGSEAGVDFVLM